jgi:exodeoxyribonuclease V alpha subunit
MVASQALNIITGGPGTGKTYTLARIIAVLNQSSKYSDCDGGSNR